MMTKAIALTICLHMFVLAGHAQDFIIYHNDTINRTDEKGRRQGDWIFRDSKGIKIMTRFNNDIASDTVRYYEKNTLRMVCTRSWPDTISYTYYSGKTSCSSRFSDEISYCSTDENGKAQIRRFLNYEMPAAYYGGDTAMKSYLKREVKKFPADQKGTVKVSFTIDEAGRPIDARVKSSDNPELNSYCLSAVAEMPRWQAAYQKGTTVRAPEELPIVCK
jgi:TonB family protein